MLQVIVPGLVALLLSGCGDSAESEPGIRNVLLITADDLGLQLGSYGESVIETPHLDGLAARSTQFDVAYVTQASCSSSRSSIFSGLYPHATGQYGLASGSGLALHPHLRAGTLPNVLKRTGMRTGIIGKLHVDPESSFLFDQRVQNIDMRRVRDVARVAGRFMVDSGAQPFFLLVSYSDPHTLPVTGDADHMHFPTQVDGLPEEPVEPSEETLFDAQQVDSEAQRRRTAGYYNAVQRLDVGVGLLLEALQEAGHAEDTLVIFVGDHGPPFCRGKTTTYEFGLRIPFLVHWPGVSLPMRTDAMVSTVDIFPTVLDALGVDLPPDLHGASLRGLVSDPEAPQRDYLVGEFHFHAASQFFPRRAIRDRRYKLIHNLLAGQRKPRPEVDGDKAYVTAGESRYEGTDVRRAFETFVNPPEYELYDLEEDPVEFHNLAGDPEMEEIESRLKQALMDWRHATRDPFLDPDYAARYARFADDQPGKQVP